MFSFIHACRCVGRRRIVKGVKVWRCGVVEVGRTRDGHRKVRNPDTLILNCFRRNIDFYYSKREAFIPNSRFGAFKPLQINQEQFLYTSTSRNHHEVKLYKFHIFKTKL